MKGDSFDPHALLENCIEPDHHNWLQKHRWIFSNKNAGKKGVA